MKITYGVRAKNVVLGISFLFCAGGLCHYLGITNTQTFWTVVAGVYALQCLWWGMRLDAFDAGNGGDKHKHHLFHIPPIDITGGVDPADYIEQQRADVVHQAVGRIAIFDAVNAERNQQDAKWGDQSALPRERMVCALVEEVGEVAEAVLGNGKPRDLRAELVQVAALAVQMIEHIDVNGGGDQ